MKETVTKWHIQFNERQKLQHVYELVAVISFVIASVISLVNAHLGRKILFITGAAVGVFLLNAVVWSVLNSAVLSDVKPTRGNRR